MAAGKWVSIGKKHCELIDLDVELKELRVYPTADILNTFAEGHMVRICVCSAAIRCNMDGIPCQWAYNSPDNSRF